MEEVQSTESNINIDKYKKMPLTHALLALEGMPEKDAEKIINLRKKDLGQNPTLVAELFHQPLGEVVKALSGNISAVDAKVIINLKDGFGTKPNVKKITELSKIVESLKEMNSTEAEKVIRKNEKEFGRNPAVLISLVKASRKLPDLQKALDKTNLVETKYLKVELARALLSSDSDPSLRELRNQAIHAFNSTIPRSKGEDLYSANPQAHAKDSIHDLVKFMINRSESAFSFLRKPKVQTDLSKNPLLVARMFLKGDANLTQTMQKEGVFDLFTGDTKEIISHIQEIKNAVNTPPLNDTTIGRALKNRLETLIETVVERDGKNIIEVKTELSLSDATALQNDVQKMQGLYQTLQEIHTALKNDPSKDNTSTRELLRTLETTIHRAGSNIDELNKISPQASGLQKELTETAKETHTVEYIGPLDTEALRQESKKEQEREERAQNISRPAQKKWPQQEKKRSTTIKTSQFEKDVELKTIAAELKKPEPVSPPPSPSTVPKSPGRR